MEDKNSKECKSTHTNTYRHRDTERSPPVITVDYERYAHFLDNVDWSEEEKAQWLQAVWNIIVEVVSLGWGVHPLQQIEKTCGQPRKTTLKPPITGLDQVLLGKDILTENFEDAVCLETDSAVEGVNK